MDPATTAEIAKYAVLSGGFLLGCVVWRLLCPW